MSISPKFTSCPSELTPKRIKYCVLKFQVRAEGSLRVKVKGDIVPERGILPYPTQPVQIYLVSEPSMIVDVIDSVISVPASNQVLEGKGVPWADVTITQY